MTSFDHDCFGCVIVSVIASIAVDYGFEPRSGQTKDYEIVMFVASPVRQNEFRTGLLGIMIIYTSGA